MESLRGANLIVHGNQELGGIYLGSIKLARDENALRQNNIKAVLTVLNDFKPEYSEDITHLKIDIQDHENVNICQYFQQAFEFIEEQRRKSNILIHCFAGISRSSTILIAYLMRKQGLMHLEAHHMVKKRRSMIRPNKGFEKQLGLYEKALSKNEGFKNIKWEPERQFKGEKEGKKKRKWYTRQHKEDN